MYEWALISAPSELMGDQRTYGRVDGHDIRTWKENLGRNGKNSMRSVRGNKELANAGQYPERIVWPSGQMGTVSAATNALTDLLPLSITNFSCTAHSSPR
jgi:hypothetical protein